MGTNQNYPQRRTLLVLASASGDCADKRNAEAGLWELPRNFVGRREMAERSR